ncbi:MAG: sialidase family protein [Planctomycetota bacterium]
MASKERTHDSIRRNGHAWESDSIILLCFHVGTGESVTLDGGGWVDIPFAAANPFDGSKDYIIEVRFMTSTSRVILLTSCPVGEPGPPGQPPWPLMVFTEDGGEIRVDFWYKSSTQSSVGGFVDGTMHTATMHTAEIIFESPSTWTFIKDGSPAGSGGLDGATDVSNDVVRIGSSASSQHLGDGGLGVNFNGQIDYIRIWAEEETEAVLPEPGHNATNVCPNDVELSWVPGKYADTHDVYFGSTVDDVNISTADPCATGLDSNSWMVPYRLEVGTTYYWRVVEVNLAGPDPCYWPGDQWQFTTNDGNAYDPYPADNQTVLPVDTILSWSPGCFATGHHVYFGTDFNDVNDANSTVTLGVYKGCQEHNSYDPGPLELDTAYYWRIDEVNDGNVVIAKGDVWGFRTAMVRIIGNVIVYHDSDKWCATPSNCGVYTWGDDEILVGFVHGPFIEQPGHNVGPTIYSVLGRSGDGGQTWTMEDPNNFVGDGGTPSPSPGNINFAHPDFAMRVVGTGYHGSDLPDGAFFFSYDRGHTWGGPYGPYELGNFGEPNADSWERTPRTDYIVNGPNDCLVFMSVRSGGFGTDRAFCVRTTDGGQTFQFQGWIVPPSDPYRAVMPSTVRCSSTKLVTALRRRAVPDDICWVDAYVSNDNGVSWTFLSKVADTGNWNGNPPALLRLKDGRLCCVYGNRAQRRMKARYTEDEGITWGQELTLRDDYEEDSFDDPDLGYPRLVQRPDGMLVTMYFWATVDRPQVHIAGTIWDPGSPSCQVHFKHFAQFAQHWLQTRCDPGNNWCGGADLNQMDGVDGVDLRLFVNEWLQVCPADWPWN